MYTKEELELIKAELEEIKDFATTKRDVDGVLLSDSRVLTEIAVKANNISEYVGLLLKED